MIRVHTGCGPARRRTCGHPCPEQPEQVAVRELLKPCSLDAQPGTERRRCGGTDPPGAPGPCGPLGGRVTSPHPPGSREARQGWEGPVGLHRPRGSARPRGWALGRGVAPRRGVAWPVRSCRTVGGGDALVPRGGTPTREGGARAVGTPEITCPLGLTCLGPDGLQRQENILRRPALVREPRTSCDLAGVLGLCQLSKDGVPSLQACLGQRPFSGWRWGRPLRGGGLGGAGGRGHWEAHRSRGQTFSV